MQKANRCVAAAELVDAYIRLRGDLAAFEAEAQLPQGMLTGLGKGAPAAAAAQPKAGAEAPNGGHSNGAKETPDGMHASSGNVKAARRDSCEQRKWQNGLFYGAGEGAAFLLNAALRSMAGGNVAAARQRFALARDELSAQAAKSGYTPALSCQLGEVCGSQARAQHSPN
jgi:hypothetical protein